MSGVYWGALAQMPNPGQAFADSFNQGMERNRQQEQEWLKYIGTVAAWAETPEQWDQAVDYFVQSGYKAAEQFRGKFEMRVPLMARAGITPPKSQGTDDITEYQLAVKQGFQGSFMDFKQQSGGAGQDPSIIREYQIATERRLIPDGTTYPEYVAMRSPGAQTPIIRPHNVVPVEQGGGTPVRVNSPQEVEALAPGTRFIAPDGSVRVKPGGTGSNAGGGFPR